MLHGLKRPRNTLYAGACAILFGDLHMCLFHARFFIARSSLPLLQQLKTFMLLTMRLIAATPPAMMHRVARRLLSVSPIHHHSTTPCRLFAAKPSPVVAQAASAGGAGEQGQITAALMSSMRSKISQALETEQVSVVDTSGDGRHVAIDVVSSAFEGLNAVKRQRLVYKVWL